jgi:uncharacterized Tic20 family protein
MMISEELARLASLHQAGTLTDAEFTAAKERLIASSQPRPMAYTQAAPMRGNTMHMWLHLSQLLGFVIPLGGFVAPIIIWQTQKDKVPGIDEHGKEVVNWLISSLLYYAVAFVLAFAFIGLLLLPCLMILNIVFAIIGGIRAGEGNLWKYPFSIKFIH